MSKIDLNGLWKLSWKEIESGHGVPECEKPIEGRVPGDVHLDLVRAGVLPEPLEKANAPLHEWVEYALFTYEREFSLEDEETDRTEITFCGLDCFATVYLDDKIIGEAKNAFVPHTFDITEYVEPGSTHRLRVELETGVVWAKAQDHADYQHPDSGERIFLRKSQFSFKWDWAPRLVTCGMWRGVTIDTYKKAVVRDVDIRPEFSEACADVRVRLDIESFENVDDSIINVSFSRGTKQHLAIANTPLAVGVTEVIVTVTVDDLERWDPIGYGDPSLYDMVVTIDCGDETVCEYSRPYGFREVVLKREPLASGDESFIICINGNDIFCKGANWVPADSILARVNYEKYAQLLTEAADANFNMMRIWGGGIYEDDDFYQLCDSMGIMVWQDFMFACAEYPDDRKWFCELVAEEAEKAVKRLKFHPSIVLWCGNNENDWMFEYYFARNNPDRKGTWYGQKIYHEILPEICKKLDPTRPYWPSSPYGDDFPNGDDMGDKHAWDVSIHAQDVMERADFRNYRKDRGKFISEYGILSYALPETILDYTQDEKLDFTSEAYKLHDNDFNRGMTDRHLELGFGGVPADEEEYIYKSLAYQAMGYREAIAHFRMRKFDCAGSLFWMYSDCWGTHGWTIIDYYMRRKPSYYWVKKAYSPLAVFARYENGCARTYVVNDTLWEIPVTVFLECADMYGEGDGVGEDILLPPNSVAAGPWLECDKGYMYARIEKSGRVRYEDLTLTHLPSEIDIPPANIEFDFDQQGNELVVTVTADSFGHFVWLDLPYGARPSDNFFNIIPARPKVVHVAGTISGDIEVNAINMRK